MENDLCAIVEAWHQLPTPRSPRSPSSPSKTSSAPRFAHWPTAGSRDLIGASAAADRWSRIELEELGRRHARDSFDLAEVQARLGGTDWIDGTEFAAYGFGEHEVAPLRMWAQAWVDDIAERLLEGETSPEH